MSPLLLVLFACRPEPPPAGNGSTWNDLGNIQVATSADGFSWSSLETIRDEEGASNPTVALGPDGVWWLYWNEVDEDCVEDWRTADPPEDPS